MEQTEFSDWKKKIILFLTSQTFSLFGSSLVSYAIMWYIVLSTQSGVMMTIYILCGLVPTFLLSPIGGVWADRYNRKLLIGFSDSIIAAATLILAILFLMGYENIWLLFGISAIRALGSGVQMPAVGAILPQIVPEDKLTAVNGVNTSIQSFVALASPMLSGALLTVASIKVIFFIDVFTALTAVAILFILLDVPIHAKALEKQAKSYFHDIKQGIVYVNQHPFIKRFFIFFAVFSILVAPSAFLTPLQVARSFGPEVWRLTALEVSFALGMMAGGLLIAVWGGFKNKVHTMALSVFLISIWTALLGIVPIFWVYLGIVLAIGLLIPAFNTPTMVLLQEKVEPDYLGRVFGVFTMIATSMMPLGMLIFGPLADVFEIEWMLIGTGIAMFMMGFFLIGNKVLLEAGKPKEIDGEG